MSEGIDVAELNLSDAELIEVLKNHGLNRRVLMKALGAGAVVSALGGTAAGHPGKGTRIDDVFGTPYAADDTVPTGIVDHVVDLDVLGGPDGQHGNFPVNEDGEVPAEFVFDPVGLHVKPGDVVHFDNLHHEHTVTAFHEKFASEFLPISDRVPEGVPGFTSPVLVGGESWLYRFNTKGVYDLFCFPHLFFGMVMRIVVFDPEEDSVEDLEGYGSLRIPNAGVVLDAPEMTPSNIVDAGEVAWADLSL